jgi:hypothetical protein
MTGFKKTASAHRRPNEGPITMPTDRTHMANSATIVENEPGRFTDSQFRELLRLSRENPEKWTAEVLAQKYQADKEVVKNILKYVCPPKIIAPTSSVAYPFGVWF